MTIDLKKLSEPFWPGDIEWRVSQSGMGRNAKPWCKVLAYITARAISFRLDSVCGPENWKNTSLEVSELRPGVFVMQVGISIRIGDEWITKYDVSEPTNFEPAKGGFSGAMKRAGQQWGIARYLYHLDEAYADVITPEEYSKLDKPAKEEWKHEKLKQKRDGDDPVNFYWRPPNLPGWALPKHPATGVKKAWMAKFAPNEDNLQVLASGFRQFVFNILGKFPIDDPECWTDAMVTQCMNHIKNTTDVNGPDSSVPFG